MNFSNTNILHQVIIEPKKFKGPKYREEIEWDAWQQEPANLTKYINIFYANSYWDHLQHVLKYTYFPFVMCDKEHWEENGSSEEYKKKRDYLELCSPLKKDMNFVNDK